MDAGKDNPDVSVQAADFDVAALQSTLLGTGCEAGAVASFIGLVRRNSATGEVCVMELEHYPGMTEHSIQKIVDEARQRRVLAAGPAPASLVSVLVPVCS